MTVPEYTEKHDADAIITPEIDSEYLAEQGHEMGAVPEVAVLTFQPQLFDSVTDNYAGEEIADGYPLFDLYRLEHEAISVAGGFGIGAPTAAMVAEELIQEGVETVLVVGWAGTLSRELDVGEFVVCDRALRDEGVSHHYLEPARWIEASPDVTDAFERAGNASDRPTHTGPTWTTSAPYRETVPETTTYAEEGVLTVEMEAAAVFAVARYRGVDAGAMFTVSDYVGPDEWDPQFHDAASALPELFETVRVACQELA